MFITTVLFLFLLSHAKAANILGVFPMGAGSHYILSYKLMKGLSEAGHDVTLVAPIKAENPPTKGGKFTEIFLEDFQKAHEEQLKTVNLFNHNKKNAFQMTKFVTGLFAENTRKALNHPKVKALVQSNIKFDAVILEHFNNDALKVLAHLFNCPLILLSSTGPSFMINPTVGNPQPVSYIRNILIGGDPAKEMTFIERTTNLLFHVFHRLLTQYYVFPIHNDIIQNAYPNSPDVNELYTNASLVLLNSHTSFYAPHPLVPNMVEIGGYHIDPPQKLPQDLQEFLDRATDGAIYFSMGSNLKSKDISEEKKQIILNVLGQLKQKVIWKFEEDLPGKPDNILIKKWLPQQDILAHPNIKLFITHGGLLSTTETVYHGIPILAIPVFADQPTNAARAVSDGYALKINYNEEFTEDRFREVILELLTNPKYTENIKKRSKLFHDRPQKPLDTAVYWVEYVIRHKDVSHLRVAGIKLPWYKYFMVDVIVFLLFCSLLVIWSLKYIFRKFICKSKTKTKQKIN